MVGAMIFIADERRRKRPHKSTSGTASKALDGIDVSLRQDRLQTSFLESDQKTGIFGARFALCGEWCILCFQVYWSLNHGV